LTAQNGNYVSNKAAKKSNEREKKGKAYNNGNENREHF
jgi:hypothetical protein